jgi:hypothetical protein
MIRAILSRVVTRFERTWNYDAGYLREALEVSPSAFLRFMLVGSLGHGRRAPVQALAAAGIAGSLSEDCGPCTQIGVDMAAKAGVAPAILRAILAGDETAMGRDARLGYDFARAVLDRDLEKADSLRDDILHLWGKGALVDLGFALTTARMYPTLKYALGHGRACSRVTVRGEPAPFSKPRPIAA